jgi:glucose/arabinose dehydrogenase
MSAMLQERPAVGLELIAGDLTAPVTLVEAPDKTGRLFIVDQIGMIWIVDNGNVLSTPFLDVQDRMVSLNPGYDERGLLGLAFHPDYATNGRFFVYYNAPLSPTAPPRLQPHQSPL